MLAQLAEPPAPLSRAQTRLFLIAAIAIALTRFVTRARSLWDWDEALFCQALGDYDVTAHHPHPPGFPLYIALARIAQSVIGDEFRSLQAVVLLASMLLFPAVFLLARELRLPFASAMSAAAISAFFPVIWIFGGSAFSDILSLTLTIAAVAYLLRGCRSDSALFAGALLIGCAVAVRPQSALYALAPAAVLLFAVPRRRLIRCAAAGVLAIVIAATAYAAAAVASGEWTRYRAAVSGHREWMLANNSYRAAGRTPLPELATAILVQPYRARDLGNVLAVLALTGVAFAAFRRDRLLGLAAAIFLPYMILTWLMLDVDGYARFSTGYLPLFALFIGDLLGRAWRRFLPSRAESATWITGAVLAAALALYTLPAARVVRKTLSPPVAAAQWIRQHANPATTFVYVDGGLSPHADFLLKDYQREVVGKEPARHASGALFYTTLPGPVESRAEFHRERGRLWHTVRAYYFDVFVRDVTNAPTFGAGWYDPDSNGRILWRWMGRESVLQIHADGRAGTMRYRITIPHELVALPQQVTITANGVVVDSFAATQTDIVRETAIPAATTATTEVRITTTATISPARAGTGTDTR
ncbi:MAG TPA: hypothetical protein VF911_18385, partial [Thermoanaerobaculia bacterium]